MIMFVFTIILIEMIGIIIGVIMFKRAIPSVKNNGHVDKEMKKPPW